MSETWKKFDNWKSNVELIPWNVLMEVGKILWFWKEKYWKNNWQKLEDFEDRYIWAALRHIYQHQDWEKRDQESWMLHLSHALTNLIFLVFKELEKDELWKAISTDSWKNSE